MRCAAWLPLDRGAGGYICFCCHEDCVRFSLRRNCVGADQNAGWNVACFANRIGWVRRQISFRVCVFRKCVLPEGLAKELSPMLKIPFFWDSIDFTMFFERFHMQFRCKKHPRCIQTHPRPILQGPGAGKYGLGTRGRKTGFRVQGPGARKYKEEHT